MYERQRLTSGLKYEDSLKKATTLLGRVKVMRVFDLAGLIEAAGEIGEILESATQEAGSLVKDGGSGQRTYIADSEDETDDEERKSTDDSSARGAKDDSMRRRSTDGVHVGMIVIDTITNVVGPVMAKGQVQGDIRPILPYISYSSNIFSLGRCISLTVQRSGIALGFNAVSAASDGQAPGLYASYQFNGWPSTVQQHPVSPPTRR